MGYQEITDKLRAFERELREMGITRLALFGSHLRGEAGPDSDVDLLVEFSQTMSLFEFFTVQHRLEEMLGVEKVDLVQSGALHPALKDDILAEARYVV